MPGGRGVKKSGRGDGGRGEASRQSRRVQGMEPEEHKDLETVVRDARKAKKAARESEAVQGGDVEASAEEEVSPGFQGSTEVNSGSRIPEVPEEHTREGGAQASEGGANAVEPPGVIDLVSSSDESVVEVKSEPSFSAKFASGTRKTPESDIREVAAPAPESGAAALDAGSMVLYVRREVRRWEEVNPGKVTPPTVVYEWPTPKPDANSYFAAAYATGDYLKWRLSLENQDEAWISEFHLARWGVGTAQDLMATTIPQTYKSSTGASLQNSTPLNSMSNGRDSLEAEAKDATPGAVPNVIGTSRASDESTASGVQTSYGSSSSSLMMSLGQRVEALALVAQSAGGFAAAGDLGFQVTRTVIPSRIVSGPAQIELNVLRQQQEWQARMEQEQREFLAIECLDALERECLREQRNLDARRQIQELTDHLVHAEIARGEAERRAQDVEARQTQSSTETQGMTQSITEAVRLERERLDAAYAERWRRHEAKADSERARWVSETYAGWKEQMSTMEQKVQELEAEKERERESSENIQRFHAGQVRDFRATLAQVQARRATVAPDLATNVRLSVAQNPEVATRPQESSGVINGNASVTGQRRETADPKNTSEVAASQLRATLAQTPADTSGRIARVKRGHGATETKVTQDVKLEPVSLGKTSDPRRTATSNASQDSKTDSKRSAPKKHQQQKKKRQDVNPPSDADPSSDSSDDDSSSESSDDSSDGNPGVNLSTASTAQAGTTLLTFRPYINSNTLGEFDTKASLRERVHWWERFANMAAQGGWSTKMRIQELKLKLSGAARDWFNQLPKHTQRDWKELASAFRKKYCKARSSYSERYFTIEMKNSESALDFFYRLNSAAGKADIDFRKSSKRLEKHIRRFITKLRDTRLKTSLQDQRSRCIADLEYALEQDEDVWSRRDHDAPPPREITDESRVSARSASANSGSTREISGEEASTPSVGVWRV
ncbi:hypothetical protein PHYSODRAFT_250253 [Phytophthora sojae]|uniref:Retrotransposon gag domain-containing protein n=1 Tax=Phytophthora sojae (strain P6497) TaxID=1094619 RepID=G5A7R9_PHYSP|nr:hypothetical protein PHYSODRAFT_250253 [Phytophthora sojae]EGZ07945.1 hypothetical protein PHYSODRAFT_250253 [Phytophthora sojae]|eukprot:XP_009536117.1 hypothetical protein PHYSODRAFT_250253 [Phytophthora sojae]